MKIKKPFYKKWWFIVIIGAVVIITIANMGEEAGNKEEEEQIYSIGDEVQIGDAQYTVNGFDTASEVGPSFMSEEASGTYIILDVTLQNNGNEAITTTTRDFQIIDGENVYEADTAASISANHSEDGSISDTFNANEVNPGSEVTANVAFDVSGDVFESDTLLLYLEEGFFSLEAAFIDLK